MKVKKEKKFFYIKSFLIFIFFFLLLFTFKYTAYCDLYKIDGHVYNSYNDEPIKFVTVIIKELELITYTDEKGYFIFTKIPAGEYNLLFFIEGFQKKQIKVRVPSKELKIFLDPIKVEYKLEVKGKKQLKEGKNSVPEKEIKNTPTGGDPLEITSTESSSHKISDINLDRNINLAKEEIENKLVVPLFQYFSPYSYRNLPFYSNIYLYDNYIPLPFISYPDPFIRFPQGVVPFVIIKEVDLYQGTLDFEVETVAGMITSINILSSILKKDITFFSTSLLKFEFFKYLYLNENSALIFSLRKSLHEFTIIPLAMFLIKKFNVETFVNDYSNFFDLVLSSGYMPGNLDIYLRYILKINNRNKILIDFFNCSAYFVLNSEFIENFSTSYLINFIDFYQYNQNNVILNKVQKFYLFQFTSFGVKYRSIINKNLLNEIAIFNIFYTYYNSFKYLAQQIDVYELKTIVPINYSGIKDILKVYLFDNFLITTGIFLKMYYQIIEHTDMHNTDFFSDPFLSNQISIFLPGASQQITADNNFFKNNTFNFSLEFLAGIKYKINKFKLNLDCKIEYLSITKNFYPEIGFAIFYDLTDKSSIYLQGSRIYDKIDYILRFLFQSNLDTNKIVINNDFIQNKPALLYNINGGYELFNKFVFKINFYYNYMEDLTGFNFQTIQIPPDYSYYYLTTLGENIVFKPSDKMYSFGIEIIFKNINNNGIIVKYNFAYSQYHLRDEKKWVFPNSDVMHTIKFFYRISLFKNFFINLNLNIFEGIAQTPNKVIQINTPPYIQIVPDFSKFNELRDWMPRFTINFLFKYKWHNENKTKFTLFLDIINLISFPHYSGPKELTPGFTENSWLDRLYDWTIINLNIGEIKINFGIEIIF